MKTLFSRLRELTTTLFSRLRERPVLASIAGVALVLALGLGITSLVIDDDIDSDEVVNQAGGYQLRAPDGWEVTQQGPITKMTSRDKGAVVRVSPGNRGALHESGALFFQQVGRHYKNTKLTGVESEQVGPRPALVYGGLGLNDKNVKINFLAITVEAKPTNYAISVFTAANSDAQHVLPRVNSVVDTFRAIDQR